MSLRQRIASWFGVSKEATVRDPTWELAGARMLQGERLVDPYQQHCWVYACIRAIATSVASVPWRLYTGNQKNAQPIESGEIYDRFNRPNSLWTRYHLWEATASLLKSCGNAMWVLKRDNPKQPPNEILVFSNAGWGCDVDASNRITRYVFEQRDGKGRLNLAPEHVIHFRTWNPNSAIWGIGELEAARMSAEQDYLASLYNRSFFTNSAMPGGIIKMPAGVSMTEPQWTALKARWADMHQGSSKAFRLAALNGGAEFEQISLSHRDMMFLEQRKWNRGEILACFRVPPSELGIFDDVQKAVQESVERGFWAKTLLPVMRLIEDTLRAQFFMPLDNEKTWGKFDTSGVSALQKNTADLITQARQLWDMGMPLSEINSYLGMDLPDFPGADQGYLGISYVPVESIGDDDDTEDDTKETAPAKAADDKLEARAVTRDELPHTPEQLAASDEFVRTLIPPERGMHESVRVYLQRIKKWLADAISKYPTVAEIPINAILLSDQWDDDLRKLARKHYKMVAEAVKPRIEKNLEKIGIDFTVDLSNKRFVDFLRAKEIKIVRVNDTIRSSVKEALIAAKEGGATLPELQESIFNVIQDTRARALRIARTEMGSAANGVEYTSNVLAGVKKQMWIAARDEITRPSHLACMAQGPVKLGKPFVNGLRFPGDPDGEPGEVCNCRCSLMPAE